MHRLLSLDQSITSCGYSIFEIHNNNQSELIDYGTIKLNTKLDYFERIISLENILNEMVKDYNIRLAIIEDIQKHRGTGLTTYKKLSSLLFFLQYFFYYRNIDCQIIHVNTWRNGYKNIFDLPQISKDVVYEHLFNILGEPSYFDNHQSDSIAMGLFHCHNNLVLRNELFTL